MPWCLSSAAKLKYKVRRSLRRLLTPLTGMENFAPWWASTAQDILVPRAG